jgi:hypothetical protein
MLRCGHFIIDETEIPAFKSIAKAGKYYIISNLT